MAWSAHNKNSKNQNSIIQLITHVLDSHGRLKVPLKGIIHQHKKMIETVLEFGVKQNAFKIVDTESEAEFIEVMLWAFMPPYRVIETEKDLNEKLQVFLQWLRNAMQNKKYRFWLRPLRLLESKNIKKECYTKICLCLYNNGHSRHSFYRMCRSAIP